MHFILAWIHPFLDGNGRTARSIFYWYMMKNGYRLTEFMSISRIIYKSKAQYEKNFIYTEMDDIDMSYFINYNLKTLNLAYNELQKYIERKIEERNNNIANTETIGLNERQIRILKIVTENPKTVLFPTEIANRVGTSSKTARTDLQSLVAKGILKAVAINNKKTIKK